MGSKSRLTVFQFGCPQCGVSRRMTDSGRCNSTVGRKFKSALNNVHTPLEKAINMFSPVKRTPTGNRSKQVKPHIPPPPPYPKGAEGGGRPQQGGGLPPKYSSLVSEDSSLFKAGSRSIVGSKNDTGSARSTSSLTRGGEAMRRTTSKPGKKKE